MHGIESIVAPVITIHPQGFSVPEKMPAALLLTSRHAAPALAALPAGWRSLPVYCVGSATAQKAAAQGFTNILAGDADVLSLLPRVANDVAADNTVFYLAGEEVSVDIAPLLPALQVIQSTVYRAETVAQLPNAMLTAQDEITAVTFFSARSARIANQLLVDAGMQEKARILDAFCLSLHVAEAAGQLPYRRIHTCYQPTREAMRDLIVSQRCKTL